MGLRAILVSVDYADLLSLTLPYNRHHFEDVMVVTAPRDEQTISIAQAANAKVYTTNAFYDSGAVFNKWKALELALDNYGRHGWLCLMDADILWPKQVKLPALRIGRLYTPRRRMMYDVTQPIPPESEWQDDRRFPLHPQQAEFAGYTQIFHGEDGHLGPPPWHEIDWVHAGGADSFFQYKWPGSKKIRPPFEVLHLGDAGKNWCGRATERVDGSTPEGSSDRLALLRAYRASRKAGSPKERFAGEKIHE